MFRTRHSGTFLLLFFSVFIFLMMAREGETGEPPGGDPLERLFQIIQSGMSIEEVSEKAGELNVRVVSRFDSRMITFEWYGEDFFRTGTKPFSVLYIKFLEEKVVCVYYRFAYERDPHIRRERGIAC